jgi:hypothetical protein
MGSLSTLKRLGNCGPRVEQYGRSWTMSKLVRLAGLTAVVAAIAVGAAFGAKPGSSSATLYVSGLPAASTSSSVSYGTPYTVKGCGYSAANGGVTVVVHSPEAISFAGQLPDANGCISVTNFSTQGPGHYQLDAWQHVGKRDVDLASTSFDLS